MMTMEKWLLDEVVKSYDEFAAASQTGIPAEEMMARVRAAYQGRRKETGTS